MIVSFWHLLFLIIFMAWQFASLKLDLKILANHNRQIKEDIFEIRATNDRFMSKYEEKHNETKDN